MDLLSPSDNSRAINQPRPQNPFMLFRRNFSKGLKKARLPIGVGLSSKIASEQWKSLSEDEKEFWKNLSIIAKEIHKHSYPGYKYNPVKSQVKIIKKSKKLSLLNLKDVIENIKSLDSDTYDSSSELNDLSDLSSNINESNNESFNDHPITKLIDNFYEPMDVDLLYKSQDFCFQPTDSILNQNELSYDLNFYDPLIDPTLFNL
jgi:hypothetical protein